MGGSKTIITTGYEAHAAFHKWTDSHRAQAFPLFLQRLARDFYEALTTDVKENYTKLTAAPRQNSPQMT
jgi:hypothetical protein